jgi:hypothetical protein
MASKARVRFPPPAFTNEEDRMSSKEVETAVGEAEDLDQRAAELRQQVTTVNAPAAELARVEARIKERDAARREAALQTEVKQRLLGIQRAVGGLTSNLEQDDVRVLLAARAYAAALQMLDERFLTLQRYRLEAAALAHRFALPMPDLQSIVLPGRRAAVNEAATIARAAPIRDTGAVVIPPEETCEFTLRTRRSYEECAGTPGFALIQKAGLVPFPELTAAQQQIRDERAADAKRRRAAQMGGMVTT